MDIRLIQFGACHNAVELALPKRQAEESESILVQSLLGFAVAYALTHISRSYFGFKVVCERRLLRPELRIVIPHPYITLRLLSKLRP
jgi:hypothetical protein